MDSFQEYADFYDKIYKGKDYEKEAEFVKEVIKKYSSIKVDSILSLGCGTASHDIILAKSGFKILGIDASSKMIDIAKQKIKKENVDIEFKVVDISDFQVEEKFDFAMAMFNIVGYMAEDKVMERMLKNVSVSIKKNALFIFDCWYGPAVLKNRPENREKEIEKGLIRKTRQKLDIKNSIIDIGFEISENNIIKVKEEHKIRFWYLQELEHFLEESNFKLIKVCKFLDLNSNISEDNWNMFVIAEKIN